MSEAKMTYSKPAPSTLHNTTFTPRLIDRLQPIQRTKPMAVLVLSPARSSTTSVETALRLLGYNVYQGMKHAFIHAKRGENRYPEWSEALDAKYPSNPFALSKRSGTIKPYGPEDFDKILGNYDAVVGWPASCFVDEMLDAYPEAKVVLMNREVEGWIRSMQRTLCTRLTWWSWELLLPAENGLIRDCIRCGQRCLAVWTDGEMWSKENLRKHYLEHNEHVKRAVSPEKLLVYRPEMGWAPLCEFLGKEAPELPYPREAVGGQFEKQGKIFWVMAVAKVTGKVGGIVALGTLGWYALGWWLNRRK